MPLKAVVDTVDALPEAHRPLYEKGQDGKFYLTVEGMVPSTRLDEFRNNNITLKKELEKFEGIDPLKYREMSEKEKKILEKKLIEAGEVDKVIEQRIAAMREDHDNKLKTVSSERDILQTRLSSVLIDSHVKSAAIALGALPTAVDDVVLRAKATFQVKDGNVVALNSKGEVIYGKDGTTPLGVDDWVKALKTSAPHLFEGMKGAGASGGGRGQSGQDLSKLSPTQKIVAGFNQKTG